MVADRREYYPPGDIVKEVSSRVADVRNAGEEINYLSFVPDGEPTLDMHLGEEIELLRDLGIHIAVITNCSLMGLPDVREELTAADWVSLKVDAVDEQTWRRINHPHKALDLSNILNGMIEFRRTFAGTLVTETMLVAGVNDTVRHASETAKFLAELRPSRAYVAVPTRPPAKDHVRPPSADVLLRYYKVIEAQIAGAEYLIGYEGNDFASAGDPAENLLGITAVHPMREEAVGELLEKAGADWSIVEQLVREGSMLRVQYENSSYYLRRPSGRFD
jgi:wyosine [tRNA(Phe)-imidazoG37] synthetase (radical SAM superfamily)